MFGWWKARNVLLRTRLSALEHANDALVARVQQLEMDRPAYQLAMQNLVEEAEEFFDRAERKRGRAAAAASRAERAVTPESVEPVNPKDSPAIRAAQLRLLGRL